MPFEIETGSIKVIVNGNDASIKRKNKIIPIPSTHNKTELIDEDILITGEKTKIYLEINYNRSKEKHNKDYKDKISKSFFMASNSELKLTGFEEWDVTEDNERRYGKLVKNIYLIKGFFHVNYYNTQDPIETPVAEIIFNGNSSGFFDVYDDKVYSSPQSEKGVLYKNLKTKKTFLAKSSTPEEIVVTSNSIYRKGYVNMDEIFQNKIKILTSLQGMLNENISKKENNLMAEQMKNMGNTMEQNLTGLEIIKEMKPEDFERLIKMSGQELTPEMKEKLKEIPNMMKKMNEKGITEQIKKSSAMMKGYTEGMGSENIEKSIKINENTSKKITQEINKISKDVEKLLDNRKYKPLTKEYGAIKVG